MFDPKSTKTVAYHLLLLPSGELFNNLQNTINILAEKYHGPKFDPHVTLLGTQKTDEAELIAKIKKFASEINSFEIELKEICTEDAYFRALYCKAEHNPKLEEYHQKAMEIFNIENLSIYTPHLSLYYGNIPQSTKQEMIKSLSLPTNMKFLVDKVYLYHTEGEVEDWVQVGAYQLKT